MYTCRNIILAMGGQFCRLKVVLLCRWCPPGNVAAGVKYLLLLKATPQRENSFCDYRSAVDHPKSSGVVLSTRGLKVSTALQTDLQLLRSHPCLSLSPPSLLNLLLTFRLQVEREHHPGLVIAKGEQLWQP